MPRRLRRTVGRQHPAARHGRAGLPGRIGGLLPVRDDGRSSAHRPPPAAGQRQVPLLARPGGFARPGWSKTARGRALARGGRCGGRSSRRHRPRHLSGRSRFAAKADQQGSGPGGPLAGPDDHRRATVGDSRRGWPRHRPARHPVSARQSTALPLSPPPSASQPPATSPPAASPSPSPSPVKLSANCRCLRSTATTGTLPWWPSGQRHRLRKYQGADRHVALPQAARSPAGRRGRRPRARARRWHAAGSGRLVVPGYRVRGAVPPRLNPGRRPVSGHDLYSDRAAPPPADSRSQSPPPRGQCRPALSPLKIFSARHRHPPAGHRKAAAALPQPPESHVRADE